MPTTFACGCDAESYGPRGEVTPVTRLPESATACNIHATGLVLPCGCTVDYGPGAQTCDDVCHWSYKFMQGVA